jgi:hypothetical protein
MGMRIYMSVIHLPETSMYWSTDYMFGKFFLPTVMTRDRYYKISQYLHCADSTVNPRHGQPNHDPLHHVSNIMNTIITQSLNNYNPHREQCVDEAMIKFRGRLAFRQYLPKKPIKYGIKVWCRADPTDGYLHEFQVYTGKAGQGGRSEPGLTTHVVLDMTRRIRGLRHIVTTDNYFTSPNLATSLLQQQIYCRGTADRTRSGFPAKQLSRSDLKHKGDFTIVQKGDMSACVWMDKKVVTFLSTYDQANKVDHVLRKNKDGEKVEVPCPPVVSAYNTYMNGVDHHDQIRTTYSTYRASHRWWLYLFWFLVDAAISNAFILMRQSVNHVVTSRRGRVVKISVLDFRKNLAKQLIGNFRKQRKRTMPQNTDPHGNSHFIEAATSKGRCKECFKNKLRSEPKWVCSSCKVHLCVGCFKPYHQRMLQEM